MAVNGIEIKVGQVWVTRGKAFVKIDEHLTNTNLPIQTQLGKYTLSGKYEGSVLPNEYDLFELAVIERTLLGSEIWSTPVKETSTIDQQIKMFDEPVLVTNDMNIDGYESLANVLQRAYNQAAVGKGVERHSAAGEPFHEQVMQIGAAKFGHGALLFQAFKKSEESQRLPHDRAINELLGAINYLAGAVIALEIKKDTQP